jgi:hypothetical protein
LRTFLLYPYNLDLGEAAHGAKMGLGAIWRSIDRDLDDPRPLSLLLIILPFIPYAFALELTDDEATRVAFLVGGLAIAVPWILYVTWRGLKSVRRTFGEAVAQFRDVPLSPRQRIWRSAGALAVIACGGVFLYFRHWA